MSAPSQVFEARVSGVVLVGTYDDPQEAQRVCEARGWAACVAREGAVVAFRSGTPKGKRDLLDRAVAKAHQGPMELGPCARCARPANVSDADGDAWCDEHDPARAAPAVSFLDALRPRVELVEVTPAMAEEWLSKALPNRRISDATVARYAADMASGAWRVTHQGIAFDQEGRLADGEHRLWAVAKAKVPVRMYVTRGLTAADRAAIDQGRGRSVADAMVMAGSKLGPRQLARAASWFRSLAILETGRIVVLSPAQVQQHLTRYGATVEWALESLPKTRPLSRAGVLAAFVYVHRVAPAVAAEALPGYVHGAGLAEGSPLLALRAYVLQHVRAQDTARRVVLKALRALAAVARGESLHRLEETDEGFEHFAKLHAQLEGEGRS